MNKDNNIVRNQVKQLLASEGVTLTDLVNEYNRIHPDATTTRQNITNKLARQTLKYKELLEIVDILGYEIQFKKK